MIDNLNKFGLKKLGDGPNYNRQIVHKRNLSIFEDFKNIVVPKTVVEIGSWEGASTLGWAEIAEIVICVDTWLGSVEHYGNYVNQSEWMRDRLMIEDGYPTIFRTFADNIRNAGYQNKIIPLTIDSNQSYIILKELDIDIDLIYIDAAHDYYSVMNDLIKSYEFNAYICGDDYFGGSEIQKAVNDFVYSKNLLVLSKQNQFIIFNKSDNNFNNFVNLGWK
jgi:hypothetical protein